MKYSTMTAFLACAGILTGLPSAYSRAAKPDGAATLQQAQQLSAFGERAAFSPDGTRIAFVGKSYGDAFEIELATGRVRNLTGQFPHQGILRVQYLENGDYLLTGPKRFIGPNSRLKVDLFVLSKDLQTGLRPLEQGVFEGVAVGPRNQIAWQQVPDGSKMREGETWTTAAARLGVEHYVGRITYSDGIPALVEKRRIMNPPVPGCSHTEVQDFRNDGNELVFFSFCSGPGGSRHMRIDGYDLRTKQYVNYLTTSQYAEVEGISRDGTWTTVECGTYKGAEHVPPLDICRLELVPNGKLSRLLVGTEPGSTKKVSNPVVSPDGKSIAFQSGDASIGEFGEGGGIYLMRLAR